MTDMTGGNANPVSDQPSVIDDAALDQASGGNLGDTATHEIGHVVQQRPGVRPNSGTPYTGAPVDGQGI